MARRVFRSRVGVQRISKTLNPAQASYTREIRDQMKIVENSLSNLIQGLKDITADILLEVLTPTFAKSAIYCPKRTHRLVQSGYLEVAETANGVTAEMGYGRGGNPFYAVYVHENTAMFHAAPTRSKFLQAAIEEDADEIPARIAQAYKESVGA